MALPLASAVKTSLQNVYAALSDDPTVPGARGAIGSLNELAGFLNRLYPVRQSIAVVNEQDATVAAFIGPGGQGEDLEVGDVFRNTTVGDTTGNHMATAKGAALVAGDVFVVATGTAFAYLGNFPNAAAAFDFAGNTLSSFRDAT